MSKIDGKTGMNVIEEAFDDNFLFKNKKHALYELKFNKFMAELSLSILFILVGFMALLYKTNTNFYDYKVSIESLLFSKNKLDQVKLITVDYQVID